MSMSVTCTVKLRDCEHYNYYFWDFMVFQGKSQLLARVKMSPFPLFHEEKERLRNAVTFPYFRNSA